MNESRANIRELSAELRSGDVTGLGNTRARVRLAAELFMVERLERELASLRAAVA